MENKENEWEKNVLGAWVAGTTIFCGGQVNICLPLSVYI